MSRRIDMTTTLASVPAPAITGARQPRSQDNAQLAALLLSAYAGTVDSEEETMEQAVAEIERTVGGEYGPYMPEHSVVVGESTGSFRPRSSRVGSNGRSWPTQ